LKGDKTPEGPGQKAGTRINEREEVGEGKKETPQNGERTIIKQKGDYIKV